MAKVKARTIKVAGKESPPVKKNFWSGEKNVGYVLGAFAFVLYAQTCGFGYALDDVAVLHGNNFVKQGFGGFKEILTTFYWHGNDSFAMSNSGLFRPLSLLLFATEWQFFGDKPAVFHFVHIVLYAIASTQVYLLLTELFGKSAGRLALVATMLWIVLPVHTEVVANLKSADEVLALLFSVAGLRCLLTWSDKSRISTVLLAGAFFFLAFLSKEAAVLMLPIGILMLMMFRNKSLKQLITPGIILFAIALVWLAWHQWVIANAATPRITYDYRHNALLSSSSSIDQLGTAIGLQARYWVKMLIGYPLSYNYSFNEIPINGFGDIWPWISIAGIFAGIYFAWKNYKTAPALSFGIIFYFVTIALTSNVVYKIGDIFAERFTFIPSLGFCIVVAYIILKGTKSTTTFSSTAIGLVVIICMVYSVRTYARTTDWEEENQLFLADVEHAPNSARVHDNAGVIYLNSALAEEDEMLKKQLFDQAYEEFSRAYEIDPRDFQASQALGQIMYHKSDFAASVNWSQKSIASRRTLQRAIGQSTIDDPTTLLNLGDAFVRLEKYDSAVHYYTKAAEVQSRPEVYLKIGDAHLRGKDTLQAIDSYMTSVQSDSEFVAGWDKIANLKGMRGDYEGSNKAFMMLARINPNDPGPWKMLYTNYSRMGDSVQMKIAVDEYYRRGGK